MPAYSSHYIFANSLYNKINKKVDFELNKNALYLGTQGPDIFFFHRALPWQFGKPLRKVGSYMHRIKFGDMLNKFTEFVKKQKSELDISISKSYACGFICHYALDRNCHPFIYSLQDSITDMRDDENPHSAHNEIELCLDSIVIKEFYGTKNPVKFNTSDTLNYTVYEKIKIAEMLATCSDLVYPLSYTKDDVITAIDDFKHIQKAMYNIDKNTMNIICKLENSLAPLTNNFKLSVMFRTNDLEKAEKYVNINNSKWISPFEPKDRYESFYDLFDYSKEDALNMIENWLKGLDGKEITHNKSFLTGVEVQ